MTDTLVVGLHSWIIRDGNYGDFARDTNAAFALEFAPCRRWQQSNRTPSSPLL
jgi:hypothetical protein